MEKDLLIKLLNTNLDFLNNELISLVPDVYAKSAATVTVDRLKQTALVLVDDVPNDEQLKLIWGTFTSDPQIVASITGLLGEAFHSIDDEKLKAGLVLLSKPLVQTLSAVSDTNKADGEQIKAIWKAFLASPEFLAFIISNLDWVITRVVKNERIRQIILNLIGAFTKN